LGGGHVEKQSKKNTSEGNPHGWGPAPTVKGQMQGHKRTEKGKKWYVKGVRVIEKGNGPKKLGLPG